MNAQSGLKLQEDSGWFTSANLLNPTTERCLNHIQTGYRVLCSDFIKCQLEVQTFLTSTQLYNGSSEIYDMAYVVFLGDQFFEKKHHLLKKQLSGRPLHLHHHRTLKVQKQQQSQLCICENIKIICQHCFLELLTLYVS